MELVQWIVPRDDGSLSVAWAPAWADRIALQPAIRRRGAPLVSRWLPFPLAIGVAEGEHADERLALRPGDLAVVFAFALDVPSDQGGARPALPPDADDVRFAGLFGELVKVTADLAEHAGLPAMALLPAPERRGVELAVGAVGGAVGAGSVLFVADALVLLRVAVEHCAQARGLQVTDARVRVRGAFAPIDGRVASFLLEVSP